MNTRKQGVTTYPLLFLLVSSTDHNSPLTGASPTVTLSKNGAAFAAAAGTVTEVGSGWYSLGGAGLATDLNTLGEVILHATASGADVTDCVFDVVSWDPFIGAVASVTSPVTVGTVNDKVGYSLTQAFPANFASLAISGGGAVTAGTVGDKTGYSLTQAFPTNFASLAVTAGGSVTVGTVNDKTGYSLTQAFPANFASLTISAGGAVTVGTVNDKTGYGLGASGLDSVVVESGVNARQSLSVVMAAAAGTLSGAGAGSTTVSIQGGNVATTRITATVDSSGNRSAVTLALPA